MVAIRQLISGEVYAIKPTTFQKQDYLDYLEAWIDFAEE